MRALACSVVLPMMLAAKLAAAEEAPVESAARSVFQPCLSALELVSRGLVAPLPPDLASWPLYEIELEVDPSRSIFTGRMQVSLAAPLAGASSLTLLLPPPERDGVSSPVSVSDVSLQMEGERELSPASFLVTGHRVEVTLSRPARVGEPLILLMSLRGVLAARPPGTAGETLGMVPGLGGGVGVIGSISTDGTGANLLGAHPVLASYRAGELQDMPGVSWGPGNPSPPACTIMTLVSPPGLFAAASGWPVGVIPSPDGKHRHSFVAAGGRRMGVVLVPSETRAHERKVGEILVRASATDPDVAREMTTWASSVLRHYERSFGAYPWARLEVVEAPMTGALAGLRAPGLLLINTMATSDQGILADLAGPGMEGFLRELAIAHQLAHQWFGEIIDVDGVKSPAIEEALAWYAVLDFARARHGAEAASRIRARMTDGAYHLYRFTGRPDAPAGQSLDSIARLGGLSAYMGLCEGKAPGLMEALARLVGRQALRRALRELAMEARFGNLDRAQLTEALVGAAPKDGAERVPALFSRWLDGVHGDEDLGSSSDYMSRIMAEELSRGFGLGSSDMQQLMEEILRAFGGFMGP